MIHTTGEVGHADAHRTELTGSWILAERELTSSEPLLANCSYYRTWPYILKGTDTCGCYRQHVRYLRQIGAKRERVHDRETIADMTSGKRQEAACVG